MPRTVWFMISSLLRTSQTQKTVSGGDHLITNTTDCWCVNNYVSVALCGELLGVRDWLLLFTVDSLPSCQCCLSSLLAGLQATQLHTAQWRRSWDQQHYTNSYCSPSYSYRHIIDLLHKNVKNKWNCQCLFIKGSNKNIFTCGKRSPIYFLLHITVITFTIWYLQRWGGTHFPTY